MHSPIEEDKTAATGAIPSLCSEIDRNKRLSHLVEFTWRALDIMVSFVIGCTAWSKSSTPFVAA